ncbi:MAG TPA: nucleoside-diphosphate sugar epimerase/dehydratase [Syntrophorhabdaceae bacterium]|nr:nucleoside-diphosphate sugar epimerase/dehydratase [Syntrophorhabdaceae bacterium]
MKNRLIQNAKRVIVLASDAVSTVFAYWFAYILRFNFSIPEINLKVFFATLPVLLLIRVFCFYFFKLYSGVWRYASMNDLLRILKATVLSSFLFFVYVGLVYQLIDFPRSVFIIDWFIIVCLVGGSRFLYRLFREFYPAGGAIKEKKKVIIVGAGRAGEMLLREMRQNSRIGYEPVGFLDDNTSKKGMRIHGLPVLGKIDDLEKTVDKKQVQEAIIAIPTLSGKEMRRIIQLCENAGIPCKTVPAISDILNGTVHVNQIRQISIEDLLGREHVELNERQIREYLTGKRVLVTGAAGSIGSELCRQIMKMEPEKLILYERVENEIYRIDKEFSQAFTERPYEMVLGDILDTQRLEWAMDTFKPQVVFHAAAYKHVPIMESNPLLAIKNNVQGTYNVAKESIRAGVDKFVLISTDKAVSPANVMGATKRVAELICQGMNSQNRTRFIAVRFGNVLGSAGSVIPLFKEQIIKGGPVTVTHPEMTRYFMSIPEAAQLVMQAGAMGTGGEIFVLDMGEPVKIIDLAQDMIRLMGFKIGEDVDVVYTGLRPGEKLHEELVAEEEESVKTLHGKITMVKSPPVDWQDLRNKIETVVLTVNENDPAKVLSVLTSVIPSRSAN